MELVMLFKGHTFKPNDTKLDCPNKYFCSPHYIYLHIITLSRGKKHRERQMDNDPFLMLSFYYIIERNP